MTTLPETMFERGRRELTANQPRFFARLQELLPQGLAFAISQPDHKTIWTTAAPWSRLEPGLLVLEDLADAGKRYELKFHEVSIRKFTDSEGPVDTWGWLLDEPGWSVADFRPLVDTEDERLVRAWNDHSGRAPLPIPVL